MLETKDRQRRLAARARDIVLDEARSAGRWEDHTPSADPALVAAVIAARTTYADDILAIQRAELARAQRFPAGIKSRLLLEHLVINGYRVIVILLLNRRIAPVV